VWNTVYIVDQVHSDSCYPPHTRSLPRPPIPDPPIPPISLKAKTKTLAISRKQVNNGRRRRREDDRYTRSTGAARTQKKKEKKRGKE